MTKRKQVFLMPGEYDLGNQRKRVFTHNELAEIVANNKQLQELGYQIPVFVGHPEIGNDQSGPTLELMSQDEEIEDISNDQPVLIGEMLDLWQNEDGSLEYVIDLSNGELDAETSELPEFTSPEIRKRFELADGTTVGPIIAHIALTASPRNLDQEPMIDIEEVLQFSLADKIEEAAVVSLDQTAILDSLVDQIDQCRTIPRALRERLAEMVDTVQLAEDGTEEPSLTITETVALLEETLPSHLSLTEQSLVTAAHPGGDQFFQGSDADLSDEQAEQLAREQLLRTGFLRK